MAESPKSEGEKPTPLIWGGVIFGLAAVASGAVGVATLMNVLTGGLAWGIFWFATSALGFAISGYCFLEYRYLSRRPELRPGTPEWNRELTERRNASAWLKWRHRHRRAIIVAGSLLSVSLIGYGSFLTASGKSGALPIIVGAMIIIFIWRPFTVRRGDGRRPLDGREEGGNSD